MSVTIYDLPRLYSWDKTSMEVLKEQPRATRDYEDRVIALFKEASGLNLVLLIKWDQLLSEYFLSEMPFVLNVHPDNRRKYMGIGMDHYTVLEKVLRARETTIQPIVQQVEPLKEVDGGKVILDEKDSEISIPPQLIEMNDHNQIRAVRLLDDLFDGEATKMCVRAIQRISA